MTASSASSSVRLGGAAAHGRRRDERAPAPAGAPGRLGLSVAPASGATRAAWRSPAVDPDGPAAEAGIREGDVLEEVNGTPVRSAADLRAAVSRSKDRPALLLVRRGDDTLYVAVPTA